jgi:hypothetical protein
MEPGPVKPGLHQNFPSAVRGHWGRVVLPVVYDALSLKGEHGRDQPHEGAL